MDLKEFLFRSAVVTVGVWVGAILFSITEAGWMEFEDWREKRKSGKEKKNAKEDGVQK